MFLLWVDWDYFTVSMEKELPSPNLKIDPRPFLDDECLFNGDFYDYGHMTFDLELLEDGRTVRITRTDDFHEHPWYDNYLVFRVYDPTKEVVPSFDSKTYTYLGVGHERAPLDTEIVVIHPSVKIIMCGVFFNCIKMKVCLMNDQVEEIEESAFFGCGNLETIKLPRSLKKIGKYAFEDCNFLDAIFIPSDIEEIGDCAFSGCAYMEVLSLPTTVTTQQMGRAMILNCRTFFALTPIRRYRFRRNSIHNNDIVHQSLIDFYRNKSPLVKACWNTNVNAQRIHDCISEHGPAAALAIDHGDMTPLHILSINPHADSGSILACLDLNMSAAFVRDEFRWKNPIEYMWKYEKVDALILVIQALCIHREAHVSSAWLMDRT